MLEQGACPFLGLFPVNKVKRKAYASISNIFDIRTKTGHFAKMKIDFAKMKRGFLKRRLNRFSAVSLLFESAAS
jgi:hypothetical protein